MRLETFLPTRIARRLVGLFIGCVLLPAAALSVAAYLQVTRQLEHDAYERLARQAKVGGQILLDRLTDAADDLEKLARRSDSAGAGSARIRLVAAFSPADGPEGTSTELAQLLTSRIERHLANGRPALLAGARHVYLARDVAGEAGPRRVVGALDPTAFWLEDAARRIVPTGVELCAIGPRGPVFCTDPAALPPADAANYDAAGLGWDGPEGAVMAGEWSLFLGFELGAEPWRVVVSQPARDVLAPLATFRATFWLVVALTVVLAFWLGNVQIRRAMAPLHELEVGTRRLAQGDLGHRVGVAGEDEFGSVARSFNDMAQNLRQHFGALDALNRVGHSALVEPDVQTIARTTVVAARELGGAAGATLAVPLDGPAGAWLVVGTNGGREPAAREVRPSREALGLLAAHPERLDLADPALAELAPVPASGGRAVAFPITRGGQLAGALVVRFSAGEDPGERLLHHARLLANQTGVALANARLLTELDHLSEGALLALARTIDANSPWTAGHSERVTRVAVAIGRTMGLDPADLELLHRGGLLHDIGKIAVPAGVLDKPGPLEAREWELVRAHPVTGARILAPIAAFHQIIPLVRWHHERLDASGYPDGIGGDAIPPLVRILSVADVFDALTSERPYRGALALDTTFDHIQSRAGIEFDADVVAAFERLRRDDPEAILAPLPRSWHPAPAAAGRSGRGGPLPATGGPDMLGG